MGWLKLLLAIFGKPDKPTPQPVCGVAVIVHQATNDGPPVVGAHVTLAWTGGGAKAVTNKDGYCAFVGVPKNATVIVAVDAEGWLAYQGRYTFGAKNQDVPISLQAEIVEAPIAPHEYQGNFCGVRVPGAPLVPGAHQDRPELIFSPFYDRYPPAWRERIRAAWGTKYPDVAISWPDSRDMGFSPDQFVTTCRELVTAGFRPCVFLLSKYYDPHDDFAGCLANVNAVLDKLLTPKRACSRVVIAWEASLWMSPQIHQQLIDAIAPRCVAAGVKVYVHFQEDYSKYPENATPEVSFAEWWGRQQGKLTGVLHQRKLDQTKEQYRWRLQDILERFSGGWTCTDNNGIDGQPFDCVAFEITAAHQYDGHTSEADGDEWGTWAIGTPPSVGPHGVTARIMGSGNGRR